MSATTAQRRTLVIDQTGERGIGGSRFSQRETGELSGVTSDSLRRNASKETPAGVRKEGDEQEA